MNFSIEIYWVDKRHDNRHKSKPYFKKEKEGKRRKETVMNQKATRRYKTIPFYSSFILFLISNKFYLSNTSYI